MLNLSAQTEAISRIANGKKILFASVPADGHVNPLTGLAQHLQSIGFDVRWYTSEHYAPKITKLGVQHYPHKKALDLKANNIMEIFADRENHKSKVAKLNYDIINVFIARATEYYADLLDIYKEFPFDLMVCDSAFTAIAFVKEKMNIPVVAIGIIPLSEASKDLPPYGLGMEPSYSLFGRIKQGALRWMADHILFKKANKALIDFCATHGIDYTGGNVFHFNNKKATLLLQSATPGFEYYRSDLSSHVRFIGPLLPHKNFKQQAPWFDERLNQYPKVVLATQGTVESDVEKLLVPTLEAFKNSDTLVIVTTGGSNTIELQERYPYANCIIEDFIPFDDVMPYADVYVTNGGYGGVLLGIQNELPLVVAGVHEGKSEINARVGYFDLGINLKTETPKPHQIKRAVEEVLQNKLYKLKVTDMAAEFSKYQPNELCANYVKELLGIAEKAISLPAKETAAIY